jgi:entericidin A
LPDQNTGIKSRFQKARKNLKKSSPVHFFRELIRAIVRFPFEQRSSPPRSAAQQHWPGPHFPPPPLESAPGHFAPVSERFDKMTSFRAIILAILASVVVTGCNTVKGVGRDIESVGDAADRAI